MGGNNSKTKPAPAGFEAVSETKDRLINEEICRLLQFSFNHSEMRKEILQSALKLIPANAPSTIFSVRRLYNISKKIPQSERNFDFYHLNLPGDDIFAENLAKEIENHIAAVSSVVEADIYRLFLQTDVTNLREFYNLTSILNRESLLRLASTNVTSVEIEDIIIGWMRYNLNEVWFIGLRRFVGSPKFDSDDYNLLKTFINRLYDFRNAWNKEDKSRRYLDVLTSREQEAIYHFVGGLKDKETAALMSISKRTLDAHWQNIFNKIGVSDKILVLDKLGMITNKIPLETEKTGIRVF